MRLILWRTLCSSLLGLWESLKAGAKQDKACEDASIGFGVKAGHRLSHYGLGLHLYLGLGV